MVDLDAMLVGRGELVAELEAAAADAARGRGSIVLLTGEAGIGKTSVARALAHRARDRLVVSWGSCVADQSAPPLWPWRTVVEVAAETNDEIDQAVGASRYEWLVALREQLHRDTVGSPRLHIIEDLQWADVTSVLLLAHLAPAIGNEPLLVVATLRTGEPHSPRLDDAIEQVQRAARVLELPALDDAGVARLVRDTGTEPDDRLIALVRARTAGNPLFVTELLRAVPRTESLDGRLAALADLVPARVSDLVDHRLQRLPAPVADLLTTAAVIGTEGEVATLAAAHASDPAETLDLLDQARAAHVLDAAVPGRWRFRHQLFRDAVDAALTGAERARRHARVLDTLAADPDTPPPVIAHHALRAQPLFDSDRAVALAARAGESAFEQHAYEEAVHWFERALEAAPTSTSPRWRAELLVLSGEAQRHTGDIVATRAAFLHASKLTDDPSLLARAALGYADPGADLGIAYRTDDAVTAPLLDRALHAQPLVDSVVAVQLEARLAAELYFSDEPARARELAESALDRARRLGDSRALAIATAVVHDAFVIGQLPIDQQLAESAQMLEWARDTGSVAVALTAHRARVFDLLAASDFASMEAEILAFQRLAEPLRAPGYLWWPELWSAMRALLEGRHDVAEARALAAYQLAESLIPSLAFVNLSFQLFFLRREQGRLAEMESATRDYAASHADVPALRVAHTFLLAEIGRIDDARGALAAFDAAALTRLHDRNWPASWFQLARVVAITEDRDLAATLLQPQHRPTERCVQVSLGTVCLGAADLATAWLFHTLADFDAADGHYRAAAELNARIGARSWLAQTRADHARLLSARDRPGDRETAAELLDLAQAAALEIGLATVLSTSAPSTTAPTAAKFRRSGSTWELEYGGRAALLADSRGLRDLAYLLGRPSEAVSVLELDGDPAAPGDRNAHGRGAPVLDERARREIRERLRALDAEEAEADDAGDGARAARAREQRQQLAEAVARDLGLGGRSRRLGDPVERARKTVSTRLRRAIAAVGRVHPELGRHLERSIDTGAWCAYRPAEPIDWLT